MSYDVPNKTILITGSTDGIGKQTALELAESGARILLHGRNQKEVEATVKEISANTHNHNIDFFISDLSSLSQVRELADAIKSKYNSLEILINNAGVFMNDLIITEDGYEMTFTVNHLAPFLLTHLLLDLLKRNPKSRIITVSSIAHQRGKLEFDNLHGEKLFDGYGAYSLSKLANILFTYELADRLAGTGITVNCFHPGVITTKLLRQGFRMTGDSLKEGAETAVYLASSLEVENVSGKYFFKKKPISSSPLTYDTKLRKKFWELSEQLTGIKYL
jgi:NAD(P)-dependent dehydrogenase (short-subunit alcohol dehydrogenase family)